jgi:hypothetical protein
MTEKTIQRVFVKPDDTATINCPVCQLAKTVAVGKFRDTKHTITARCTCGHSFPISLDFRKHYRKKTTLPGIYEIQNPALANKHWKKTNLNGTYSLQAPASGGGHVLITNLSCGGLQFTTTGRHSIEIGQHARITFTLDDRKQTEISRHVIIQSITEHLIGCQFATNEPLEQGLRFYLFP